LGVTLGVGSRFHVLRFRTRFWRFRERRVPFSCFALPHSFSEELRASTLVFMFSAPGLVFGRTEGDVYCFFYFRLPNSFSTTPGASGPVFKFCEPGLICGGTEGVGYYFLVLRSRTRFCSTEGVRSCFHVLRSQTRFGRFRGRRVPFSYFARPNSFSTAPRAPGPVFMFCAPELIFSVIEGVGSRFHVFRLRTCFRRFRGRRDTFSYIYAPGIVFGGT
jgi:hypothetical protein